MPNNKVLFIVEGASDEVSFINRMLLQCRKEVQYEIYSYKCNIHVLSQILYNEYPEFETDEVEIQQVLKSKETNNKRRDMLSQRFRDIFLVFDFEPQHDFPHFDTVRRMLRYFDDSANHGKLYINYPMMQSYKHFRILPDDLFVDRKVSISQCRDYKEIVGRESKFTDINQYSYSTFISLLVHHIKKANYILTGSYCIPEAEEYTNWDYLVIFDRQYGYLHETDYVYVLNTSIFILSDFAPTGFFRTVSRHSTEFDI